MIAEGLLKFMATLSARTGSRTPLIKIQVSQMVWDQLISDMHENINWVDDGKEIQTVNLYGVEIFK